MVRMHPVKNIPRQKILGHKLKRRNISTKPVRFYVFQFQFEFDSIKFKTSIFDSVFDFQNIFDSIFDSIFNTPVSLYHIYIQGLLACTSIMQVTYNLQDCNM